MIFGEVDYKELGELLREALGGSENVAILWDAFVEQKGIDQSHSVNAQEIDRWIENVNLSHERFKEFIEHLSMEFVLVSLNTEYEEDVLETECRVH